MAIRRVVEELEARLAPAAPQDSARGKLEFKRYGDGQRRMKIRSTGLGLANGTRLELRSGDLVVALLEVRGGRAEIDEERDETAEIPPLAAGESVSLCDRGTPLLSGRLYPD